jgi:L-iditol 2-dehydrogenase
MQRTMKAAFLLGSRRFEVRDVAAPRAADDGIVIQVKACGVCGSDLRRWREGPPAGVASLALGHEIGAVVTEVGRAVEGYAVGDRLSVAPDVHCGRCYYCERGQFNLCDRLRFLGNTVGLPGGFAGEMALDGEVLRNGIVHHMAADLTFLQAGLAEPASSVLACHEQAGTTLGDTVLVIGAGPIGCLHIMAARARGARVILSQRSKTRRDLARRYGPDLVLDPLVDDVPARVRAATGGRGADIAICANPVAATQQQAVESVRKGGRVILFGGLPKASPMTTLDSNRIHYGEISVIGSFSYHPRHHKAALDLLQRRILQADLVTHTFPLQSIDEAFAVADAGEALKVMILCS